jgi:APA family basic amino acid/polyamine antiporter
MKPQRMFWSQLLHTKAIALHNPNELKRSLNAFDLTLLGIGAIIGAGIFVLTGIVAATKAGPAIVFSYMIAGTACAFTALAYAELASSIGGSGSAYGYAYAGFGELVAWIIGWDLLLEYGIAASAVAIGWSGYFDNALMAMGLELPRYLVKNIFEGGFVNLPAVLIVSIITTLLCAGIKISKYFNFVMVFIKLLAITVFIGIALFNIQPNNWHPFVPFGWAGIMHGAALIFFAYLGFDAVSTAAEETVNPQRDLPIGIIGSLLICTLLYIIVSGLLTGIAPYASLNVSSPVSFALLQLGYNFAAGLVAAGAIAGLSTVILVMIYGLTRIFLAMSRDGLLPSIFSRVHPRTQTPVPVIAIVGTLIAAVAGFTPMTTVAELVNIGTLMAFIIVCSGVIMLRYTQPNLPRPFKTPFSPLIPLLGIIFCIYLTASLPLITWIRFIIWMMIGIILYFFYGYTNSKLRPGNLRIE